MPMVNLGSTDDWRYTGFREIRDSDVLALQCNRMICHMLFCMFLDKFLFSIIDSICLLRGGRGIGGGGRLSG